MNSFKQELKRLEEEEMAEKARTNLTQERQEQLLQYAYALCRKEVLKVLGITPLKGIIFSNYKPSTREESALFKELQKEIHAVYMIELKKEARRGKKVSNAVSLGGTTRAKNYESKYLLILEELKSYHANNPLITYTHALKKLASKHRVSFSAAKRHIKKSDLEWW